MLVLCAATAERVHLSTGFDGQIRVLPDGGHDHVPSVSFLSRKPMGTHVNSRGVWPLARQLQRNNVKVERGKHGHNLPGDSSNLTRSLESPELTNDTWGGDIRIVLARRDLPVAAALLSSC